MLGKAEFKVTSLYLDENVSSVKIYKEKKTFTKTAGSYESNDDLLHKKCCSIYKNVLFFHQNFRNMKL